MEGRLPAPAIIAITVVISGFVTLGLMAIALRTRIPLVDPNWSFTGIMPASTGTPTAGTATPTTATTTTPTATRTAIASTSGGGASIPDVTVRRI